MNRFLLFRVSRLRQFTVNSRPILGSQRGQGLIEYLVIVALMGVATIAIVRVMGQTVASRFASATHALQGRKVAVEMATIEDSQYKKKDLGDFFNGAGDTRGGGRGANH